MVYANFGTEADFRDLKKLNVDVKGKIVLIRYGSISRNKKVGVNQDLSFIHTYYIYCIGHF